MKGNLLNRILGRLRVIALFMTSPDLQLVRCGAMYFVFGVAVATAHEQTLPEYLAAREAEEQNSSDPDALSAEATCKLSYEILDELTSRSQYGLIRVTQLSTGKTVRLSRRTERSMGWFSAPPQGHWTVPRDKFKVEACHGIETELWSTTLDLTDRSTHHMQIALRRLGETSQRLVSGNTHLHLKLDDRPKVGVQLESRKEVDEYLRVVSNADGLDLVYLSYLIRPGEEYITNDYTQEDLQKLSDENVSFINGEEYRHEGGIDPDKDRLSYGHVMLLDIPQLILPVSIGTHLGTGSAATDDLPLRTGIQQAMADGGTIVWCHGLKGTEALPNWVDGLIHAQNIYDGGNLGTIEEVYYPYLNAGLKIPFSTGTDWGIEDFSRVYVPLEGEISSRRFLEALAKGRSFITNGVFLDLEVDGQRSGDTISLRQPGSVRVRASAIGRPDFVSLQLIFNGKVIHEAGRRQREGHFVAEISESIDITEPGWLAVRIPTQRTYEYRSRFTGVSTNIFGKTLFAHTSPIYITVDGKEGFQPAAARQLIANLQQDIEQIRTKGAFQSGQSKRGVLKIYEDALFTLSHRLETEESLSGNSP